MNGNFDPYHTWLGIPPKDQPADHYRLLGVPKNENNADVISNAADQRMAHLRNVKAGSRTAEAQRILNELAAAKHCLLQPAAKAAYDEQLRNKEPVGEETPLPRFKAPLIHVSEAKHPGNRIGKQRASMARPVWELVKIVVGGAAGIFAATLVLSYFAGVDPLGWGKAARDVEVADFGGEATADAPPARRGEPVSPSPVRAAIGEATAKKRLKEPPLAAPLPLAVPSTLPHSPGSITEQALITTVVQSDEPSVPIQALDLISPAIHTFGGQAERNGESLTIHEASTVAIPWRPRGGYELQLTVERLEGENSLSVGGAVGDTRFEALFDGWPKYGFRTGVWGLDGALAVQTIELHGQQLQQGRKHIIVVRVRGDEVVVKLDGREIATVEDGGRRLSRPVRLNVPDEFPLYLRTTDARFLISDMSLTALDATADSDRPLDEATITDSSADAPAPQGLPAAPESSTPNDDSESGAPDPIAERLAEAKKEYDAKEHAFRAEVLRRLDDLNSRAARAGDKQTFDRIEEERAAFERQRVLPASVKLLDLTGRRDGARRALFNAYERAISEYMKTSMKAKADTVEAEFRAFWRATATLADRIQPQTVLRGFRRLSDGNGLLQPFDAELRILGRNGDAFVGVATYNGKNKCDVKGVVKGEGIQWQEHSQKVSGAGMNVTGNMIDGKLVLSMSGIGFRGNKCEGVMQFDFEKQ